MQPKILLVDDREDNLLSIEAILEADGYQFFKAYSGSQALKILLNEYDFAMILMDVKMPILNGFETATLIYEREKLRRIPIIFITANNYGDENLFKGYQAGGIDYIFKPINPDVLRAKVAVFIELYRKNNLLIEQDRKLSALNEHLEAELKVLKISEEKARQFNGKLLNAISNLESILASSKMTIEKSEFVKSDLNVLLKGLLTEMEDQVNEKKATISIEPLPTLLVSPVLIRPLFRNLIGNALQYSKKNVNPIIKIRSEVDLSTETTPSRNPDGKKYSRILIEDNGIGFDHPDKIFNPGEKIPHNGFSNGAGIGLALCKKIIEQHHGSISARSKVNEGSTFIVSLPVL
jgi:signal transduction histidine kinase